MIWLNNEVYTVFGDESILLQNEIANIYKSSNEEC